MKRLIIIPLILTLTITLVLSACGDSTPTTVVATETPQPAITETVVATATRTPESTVTATSTEIVDPNIPADYILGADGSYTKIDAVTGETVVWNAERDAGYWGYFSGFFYDRPKEVNDDNNDYSKDQLEMHIYIDSSIEGLATLPTMTHKDNTDPRSKANFQSLYITTEMLKALENAGVIKDSTEFNMVRWVNHDFSLPLTNPDGPQPPWGLWPGTIIDVHIRGDYEELKANTVTNGFFETAKHAGYGPENNYMLKIWTDAKNNLHVEIAPSLSADKWTKQMLVEMATIGPGEVFRSEDQTHPESGSVTSLFVAGFEAYPYFTFEP